MQTDKKITIREFKKTDISDLEDLLEGLHKYLSSADPLKRLNVEKNYKKIYTKQLLKQIQKHEGKIFVAEYDKKVIGCICGVVQNLTKEEKTGIIPTKNGFINDLFIKKEFRKMRIGALLIKRIEKYFRKIKCTVILLEVLSYNNKAEKFYTREGYLDRTKFMIKELQ